MEERFAATLHEDGEGFDMKMLTGTITVPDDPGCYIVSCGCGGGKTECAKSLIRQTYNDGVVYCVDTKAELDKMYLWIIENLCTRPPDMALRENDVLILSSEEEYRDIMEKYRESPEAIASKKIILLTHIRFWTDLINYFIIYRPAHPVEPFNGNFDDLMGRRDLRRYIIFDETPSFIRPFFSMPRSILGAFSVPVGEGAWGCLDIGGMDDAYRKFIRTSPDNPFPKSDNRLNRIKTAVAFGLIRQLYSKWISSKDSTLNITFTPANLCTTTLNTHILILEGAGDVLFSESPLYRLIDVPDKYNARVNFVPFDIAIKRREELTERQYTEFDAGLRRMLRQNQQEGKRSLVVVWKSQGTNTAENDCGFYTRVVESIRRDSRLRVSSYSVIYFGSSDMKSTNDYRDYTDIFLCGTWNIPNSETKKFQTSFGTITSNRNQLMWAYIQLLCRIGIRKHDGQNYTVHYSSDYSQAFIRQLSSYFNDNTFTKPNLVEAERVPGWLTEKINSTDIGAKKRFEEHLAKLAEYDPYLLVNLKTNRQHNLELSLNEIFDIIPKDRKKKERYQSLIRNLLKMGIILNIT